MSLKKIIGTLALSAALVCALGGMVGCTSPEQVIRDGLNQEIQQYKNVDQSVIDEINEAVPATYMQMLGISSEDLTKAILEGFDGTVDSVTVNGDKAEAVVTITSKSLGDLTEHITDLQSEVYDDPSQFANMSTDELYAWVGTKMMDYISNAPIETREPITIEYVKNGNTWEPTAASQTAMQSAIFG